MQPKSYSSNIVVLDNKVTMYPSELQYGIILYDPEIPIEGIHRASVKFTAGSILIQFGVTSLDLHEVSMNTDISDS